MDDPKKEELTEDTDKPCSSWQDFAYSLLTHKLEPDFTLDKDQINSCPDCGFTPDSGTIRHPAAYPSPLLNPLPS